MEAKSHLDAPFTVVEVKEDLFEMGAWKSHGIVWGREALILGLQWKVGSSKGIRVFLNPWIPRPSTFRPITRAPVGLENLRVSDLISNGSWDLDTIASLFWEVDKDAILGIPKCSRKKRDVALAF
ncbi:hypothetical protein TIFTF001_033963 [Ficus carica]|uniref:Uncharacterized protein n=1 Tax=Ficus carica TaxID=3494 RepID=A0AA88J7V0_FICCA|nr:hypothetical protein TIFTF001_033963 [Ficus carica]